LAGLFIPFSTSLFSSALLDGPGFSIFGELIHKEGIMLYWALVFFVVSLVAGIFGFGGIASATAGIAQILFYVFLVFFVVTLIAGLAGGGTRRHLP
jgi:uncharacterized membrane protein YtjA (UPF0391 family)